MLTVTQVGINCVEILVRHLSCTTKDGRGRVGMATRLAMIATLDHSWTNDHNSKLNTIGVVRKEKKVLSLHPDAHRNAEHGCSTVN